MSLQVIKDGSGKNMGVFIPMVEWEEITRKHDDLKDMIPAEPRPKRKLSELAGTLSHATADEMLNYVKDSRNEWEERLKK